MTAQHKYHPELDGVRALAALLVMVFHAAQEGLPIRGPVTFGQTGVDLFFVLSGFLITSILLRARQHDWSEVETFYVRRTLRIFPLYYGFLIASALFSRSLPGWPFWVYLQNFWMSFHLPIHGPSHFWSLAVEEQFYLVWPFLVLFSPRRFLLPILWTMIVFAPLFRFALACMHDDVFSLTFTRLDGLAAGSLLAVYYGRNVLHRHRTFFMGSILAFGVLTVTIGLHFRGHDAPWFTAIKYTMITGLYASLVAFILASNSTAVLNTILRLRPLRFIGRVSYGLYVFHPITFAVCFRILAKHSVWMQGLVGFIASFAVSVASWYGYERYFIRLKDRWAPERRPTPAAPVDV